MENSKTWLLVADSTSARLYSLHKAQIFQEPNPNRLELVSEFNHLNSRKKVNELVTDKEGRFGGRHFEGSSPKEHEAEVFAIELAKYMDGGRKEQHFRDLIVVAPPAFMGLLHKHMSKELTKSVSQQIEKDYTHQTEHELIRSLLTHF